MKPSPQPAAAATDPYARVASWLRARKRLLLTGHVRADGDCLGAQSALFHLLGALGVEATIVNPDPIVERYAFLARETPFRHWDPTLPDGGVGEIDGACLLDVAVLSRCGALEGFLRARATPTCVFDHHQPDGASTWNESLLDSTAAATGLLVYRLARKLGIALPRPALEGVFVSLATDTGWFKYSNADRETFQTVGELVAAGLDPSAIYARLFQTYRGDYPLGVGHALRSLRYFADGRLAVVTIRNEELRAAGIDLVETDDVLDLLRAVGKVEVVLLFRDPQPGRVKCSARSKGTVDVNALLRPFGGGGHQRAAGVDVAGPFDASVDRIVRAAEAALASATRPSP